MRRRSNSKPRQGAPLVTAEHFAGHVGQRDADPHHRETAPVATVIAAAKIKKALTAPTLLPTHGRQLQAQCLSAAFANPDPRNPVVNAAIERPVEAPTRDRGALLALSGSSRALPCESVEHPEVAESVAHDPARCHHTGDMPCFPRTQPSTQRFSAVTSTRTRAIPPTYRGAADQHHRTTCYGGRCIHAEADEAMP